MITRILKRRLGRLAWLSGLCFIALSMLLPPLVAMEADLWVLPMLPESTILWKDAPVEINGINTRGSHLRSKLSADQVTKFYQEALLNSGWQIEYSFAVNNLTSFIKEGQFLYLGIRYNGSGDLSDVYLVKSPSNLSLCQIVAGYLKNEVEGDTPGKDLAYVPRYPSSKRFLSILGPDIGNILFYVSEAGVEEIFSFYKERLQEDNWELVNALDPMVASKTALPVQIEIKAAMLAFRNVDKGGLNISIYSFPTEVGGKRSLITISQNVMQELGFPEEGGG